MTGVKRFVSCKRERTKERESVRGREREKKEIVEDEAARRDIQSAARRKGDKRYENTKK